MAENIDVVAIKALTVNDVDKMRNAQLKQALTTLINEARDEEPSNRTLLEELRSLKEAVAEMTKLKKEVLTLSSKLSDAFDIIHQQQKFLESLDSKERRRNLIVTGLSEDVDELGGTDNEKIRNVINSALPDEEMDRTRWTMKRLGQENERKMRPLLITIDEQNQRDKILREAKNLKDAGGQMARVYIKKDVHPAIRKETVRLRRREREEREKAENVGVNIVYDWRNRVLMRDGVIIDRFTPRFF